MNPFEVANDQKTRRPAKSVQHQIQVQRIDPRIDRARWKRQDICHNCKQQLDNEVKKEYWQLIISHFCYDAVCNQCSSFTAQHPETERSEKICKKCYYNALNQNNDFIQQEFDVQRSNSVISDNMIIPNNQVEFIAQRRLNQKSQDVWNQEDEEIKKLLKENEILRKAIESTQDEDTYDEEILQKQLQEKEAENLMLQTQLRLILKENPPPSKYSACPCGCVIL